MPVSIVISLIPGFSDNFFSSVHDQGYKGWAAQHSKAEIVNEISVKAPLLFPWQFCALRMLRYMKQGRIHPEM